MNINDFRVKMLQLIAATSNDKFDLIIGLSRGGLIPAVYLSHRFNIPMVTADISHELSVGDNKNTHSGLLPKIAENIQSILVVDDIVDSGNTILALTQQLETTAKITVASLYLKDGAESYLVNNAPSNFIKCICAEILPVDAPFIYFPWENPDIED